MECRLGCGACCIVPSISSPIPGMPEGKPAFVRCIQLNEQNECLLFGQPERPAVCLGFKPALEHCGASNAEAFQLIQILEQHTNPALSQDHV